MKEKKETHVMKAIQTFYQPNPQCDLVGFLCLISSQSSYMWLASYFFHNIGEGDVLIITSPFPSDFMCMLNYEYINFKQVLMEDTYFPGFTDATSFYFLPHFYYIFKKTKVNAVNAGDRISQKERWWGF